MCSRTLCKLSCCVKIYSRHAEELEGILKLTTSSRSDETPLTNWNSSEFECDVRVQATPAREWNLTRPCMRAGACPYPPEQTFSMWRRLLFDLKSYNGEVPYGCGFATEFWRGSLWTPPYGVQVCRRVFRHSTACCDVPLAIGTEMYRVPVNIKVYICRCKPTMHFIVHLLHYVSLQICISYLQGLMR